VKVRIGIGSTGHVRSPGELEALGRAVVDQQFDSIWISELLTQPGLDPMVALAWLAGRVDDLKLGTTFLVPGRNLLRLARQLAGLDFLRDGRLLMVAVPGLEHGLESTAIGVPRADRGDSLDLALPILRSLLGGHATGVPTATGLAEGVVLDPLPASRPVGIWLGGSVHSSLKRCGRLADGWLPAMLDAGQARAGRTVIEEAASEAGRSIDPEHYGMSIGYSLEPLSARVRDLLRKRAKRDDLDGIVPVGVDQLRRLLEGYVAAGMSKFVLRPLTSPSSWSEELATLARAVGDLQT
jgi:probable F420-dependent oxidoreductase